MIKYLFFQNDSVDNTIYPNDSALIPTERLMGMELNADGTDLTLSFKSMLQSKEEIAFGKEGFIVVIDEYNEIFLHSDITAMETTIDGSFQ